MLIALLSALVQGEAPVVRAAVDHHRVSVGEEVVYTVRAASSSLDPMSVTTAPFGGFDVIARMERTEVGGLRQATAVEIRLRAARPGRWPVGPSVVTQGRQRTEARAITVEVTPGAAGGAAAPVLAPRIRRMLERAPPPRGQPSVAIVVSHDSARVGEQVDIVTAAWFPRDLRVQLSRPPTLQTPVVDRVWTYPQSSPATVVRTRTVGGVTYDLFAAHQIVFPLVGGTVTIPPATLKYARPIARQFLVREERLSVTSAPASLTVQPLPAVNRPADFSGAVGSRLRLERRLGATTASVGKAVTVDYLLSGGGNTALWPPPAVRWPRAVRAYAEQVEEKVETVDGRLGGSKVFRFLVVPDSVGLLRLPEVRYAYFDLATNRYEEAVAGGAALPVTAADEASATAALPPPLLTPEMPSWLWRTAAGVPAVAWLLLLVLPPLVIAVRARLPRRAVRHAAAPPSDSLAQGEARLDAEIAALVPESGRRDDRALGAALRAAGVPVTTIAAVLAVRARALAARFAPGRVDDAALLPDLDAAAAQLAAARHRWRGEGAMRSRSRSRPQPFPCWLIGTVALLAAAPVSADTPARAAAPPAVQAPTPEQLYESGALSAAAAGFESRAAGEPAVAAHWYGLGATYYRLGQPGRAAAAWLRAERLAPRNGVIRRALLLAPPPDPESGRWTWVAPVRPEELLLAGLAGWLIAWVGWIGRPRARDRWAVLLVFSGAAVAAGLALRAWYDRPLAVVASATELRLSPHGRAPELARLESGGAVLVLDERPGWVLVRAPGRREGWLRAEAVAAVGG